MPRRSRLGRGARVARGGSFARVNLSRSEAALRNVTRGGCGYDSFYCGSVATIVRQCLATILGQVMDQVR